MAKNDTAIPDQTPNQIQEEPYEEKRIDDFAVSTFAVLGYTGRLPDFLVAAYKAAKLRKDRLRPGRMDPEGFAFLTLLYDFSEGKLTSANKE